MFDVILNQPMLWFVVLFAAFMLTGVGVAGLFTRSNGERRMQSVRHADSQNVAEVSPTLSLFYEDDRSDALRLLEPLQKLLAQSDPNQVTAARQRLLEAGFYRPSIVETYFTARVILGIALPALCAVIVFTLIPGWSFLTKLFVILASAALGYYLPAVFVSLRIVDRQKKFKLGMPDALDMMLVGVEAGLSLSAALKYVVREFAHVHPVVAEQFQIVSLEFQAGRSRSEALNALSKRMNIPVTRMLASMITQSEQLGTSMAQTLQVMAQELRMQRMLDAEKVASELPVKMSVPLVLFIFPALMAIALVPAILGILSFFSELN
jgi:tight adherence protein C